VNLLALINSFSKELVPLVPLPLLSSPSLGSMELTLPLGELVVSLSQEEIEGLEVQPIPFAISRRR
jgi:hypothetical protein